MKKHSNIPFFIPHAGCRNSCVFCSQVKITGKDRSEPQLEDELCMLRQTVEASLQTLSDKTETQLAFFGGSFTGIDKKRMIALLDVGYSYVKSGKIKGIRISTRPDYIDEETLILLKQYGVTDIELGIQSMSDHVLKASTRGHTAVVSYKSSELIKKHGFNFVGQMMIGLPLSTPEDEIETAEAIINMGAVGTRIYPLVVFADTPLYALTKDGYYSPLSLEDAVERTARCYDLFLKAGITVLKIGLHSSESLAEAEHGINHPSFGELVKSRIYFYRLSEQLSEIDCKGKELLISIKDGEQSKLTGHHGKVIQDLKEKFGIKDIKIGVTATQIYQPLIKIKE